MYTLGSNSAIVTGGKPCHQRSVRKDCWVFLLCPLFRSRESAVSGHLQLDSQSALIGQLVERHVNVIRLRVCLKPNGLYELAAFKRCFKDAVHTIHDATITG